MASRTVFLRSLRCLASKPGSALSIHNTFGGIPPVATILSRFDVRSCAWTADFGREFTRAAMSAVLRGGLDKYYEKNKAGSYCTDPIDIEFVSPKAFGKKKYDIQRSFDDFLEDIQKASPELSSEHTFNEVQLSYYAMNSDAQLRKPAPYTIHTQADFMQYLQQQRPRPTLLAYIPRKSRYQRAKEALSHVTAPFLNRLARLPQTSAPAEMSEATAKVEFKAYDKKTLLLEERGISIKEWEEFVEGFKEDEELPEKIAAQMKRASKTTSSERARFGLRMKDNKCEGAFMTRLSVQKEGDTISYQLAFYSTASTSKMRTNA